MAGLMTFAAGSAFAEEEKVLNIYNWSDYIAEDTIANFEKETGIKVRYDTYDNNEILHAKLVAGKTGYDIVVPSSTFAPLQIGGGLLAKLDKSLLPNLKNYDPTVQAQIATIDPGNEHLVNWLWGYTTIGINTAKVKAALGGEPIPDNVWELFSIPSTSANSRAAAYPPWMPAAKCCLRHCITCTRTRLAKARPITRKLPPC